MTDQEFHDLLKRYLKGKTSAEEEKRVEEFYKRNTEKSLFEDYSVEEEREIGKLLKGRILNEIRSTQKSKSPTRWLKIAASILIVFAIGIGLYLNQQEPEINYLTKSTTRGQKATITLSDGSVVKLNAESSITYPESFASLDSRNIKLTGEAFFDVKRDEAKPFTIQTEGLLTTVLGTSFNITAFPEKDEIEVTVATGKVSVSPSGRGMGEEKMQLLTPGQQATYHKTSNELSMREVDKERYLAWKEGVIYLSGADYKEVFEKLSRWYGVAFEFVNVPTEEWDYTGEFKDMSLELVLSTIGYSKGFEFQIRNDRVYVKFEN